MLVPSLTPSALGASTRIGICGLANSRNGASLNRSSIQPRRISAISTVIPTMRFFLNADIKRYDYPPAAPTSKVDSQHMKLKSRHVLVRLRLPDVNPSPGALELLDLRFQPLHDRRVLLQIDPFELRDQFQCTGEI